jgi:voltage-gated potassium channel
MPKPSEKPASSTSNDKLTIWQIVMLLLSVYVLILLLADTALKLSPDTQKIFDTSDTLVCFVFIGDFFWRLFHAENKWKFIKWNWIDLVSSIPMLNYFRAGRVVRVIRIVRLLRAFRSMKYLISLFLLNRAKSVFACAACISLTMIIFSSVAILNVETDKDSNIKSGEDALWWAMTTITTVGYGDKYPITTEGRIIGALLMTTGVGLFGTFTGFVAAWFMAPTQTAIKKEEEKIEVEEANIEEKIGKIEILLAEIKRAHKKVGTS